MKIDCSKVVNFLDEYKRMCKKENKSKCSACPLSYDNNGTGWGCATYIRLYPDKAVEIVQKWSDGHQQKTYAEDFFEKFPNAPKKDDSTPATCWGKIYGTGVCEDDFDRITCEECWNRIMEDKQDEQ